MSSESEEVSKKSKIYTSKWEKLKQQQLDAWQPVFSSRTVSPLFLFFGILLIPLGAVIFIFSQNIQEVKVDYTDCLNTKGEKCADVILRGDRSELCQCNVPFRISEKFEGKVYLYYQLTNFYQNHREYVDSRDDQQLLGEIGTENNVISPVDNCAPFDKDANGKIYFPCGAVANSMFNDTINILYLDNSQTEREVNLIRKGIAWDSDKKYKFKNPSLFLQKDHPIWNNFVKPRDWSRSLWELDPEDQTNNGLDNEDLMVWMRISALPTFRKLHRIIETGLSPGNYSFKINYSYEVKSFEGTKSLILIEKSFLGGRSLTFGIMSMSSGSVIFFLGIVFLLMSFKRRKTWARRNTGMKDYGTRSTTVFSPNSKSVKDA